MSVLTNQPDALLGVQRKADAFENEAVTKAFCQIFYSYH